MYDELTPEAQEKARDWFRTVDAGDNYFAESIVEDFVTVATACGFSLQSRHSRREFDAVYWSGFSAQGDGASFDGTWAAHRVNVAAVIADRPVTFTDSEGKQQECPHNKRLRPILDGFAALAAEYPDAHGSVAASHRYHSLTTDLDVDSEEGAATFKELSNDLTHWLYRTLEAEYEYQTSDEQVAETIRANEYEFTAEGERAC
jgi:hypothetical protein